MRLRKHSVRGRGRPCHEGIPCAIPIYFVLLTSILQALCHCGDCRKTTGSTYSTNGIYPEASFKLTQGTPKVFTKAGASGNDMESHFWQVLPTGYSNHSNCLTAGIAVPPSGVRENP